MKILLWATTLQADILGLAYRLDSSSASELMIVAEHVASFRRSFLSRRRPLNAPILDRGDPDVRVAVARFRPDVVVCDNHFPDFAAAPRVCAMWHGLGWKARPANELGAFYAQIERLTGIDPRGPNPRFLAQCYHERDRDWRVHEWGLCPQQCAVIGSCFADLLRGDAPYSRAELAGEYGLDPDRKTLLVNITWHYGRIFPGSFQPRWFGRSEFEADLDFLRRLFARAHDHAANVLFCLHDRKRYEPHYLAALHQLVREYGSAVCLRHKDEDPDNWAALLMADAMIGNLSSLTTFFYHFGRPTVHLCPPAETPELHLMQYKSSGLRARHRSASASPIWMNDPRDNGGLTAENVEQALACVSTALTDPGCCQQQADAWLAAHVAAPPESAGARFERELEQLVRAG